MYKEICLFSLFSKTNKQKRRCHIFSHARWQQSCTKPLFFRSLLFLMCDNYDVLTRGGNSVNKRRSVAEPQGRSFKLAVKLACRSDRCSYSIFIYLFNLIYLLFRPCPSCGPTWKKRQCWHLSNISGVEKTAPSRTHALWHQVSLCALQTRPRLPGSPPRTLPPSSRCHRGGETTDNHHLLCITFSYISGQSRATERPKNSRGQSSLICLSWWPWRAERRHLFCALLTRHHIPKALLEPSKTIIKIIKKKKKNNNKICAIYLLEQSGVGNFSCVQYRAKFVFLHSSLAKMPCGGRVDKSDQ